jgi:P22_AR N-terminal domain
VLPGKSPADSMVAMKLVVEGMGLAWQSQLEKMKAHPVLGGTITEIVTVGADGKQREMTSLPLSRLNFWLATIQPNKVPNPETRARVIEYQTECADALFDHFFGAASDRHEAGC